MRIFYLLVFILLFGVAARSQSPGSTLAQNARVTKFFPNPAISQITFSFERNFDKSNSLQIFNFIGKKVYELQTLTPQLIVDLSDFYRGVYIFQVREKTGRVLESGKFQVAK